MEKKETRRKGNGVVEGASEVYKNEYGITLEQEAHLRSTYSLSEQALSGQSDARSATASCCGFVLMKC